MSVTETQDVPNLMRPQERLELRHEIRNNKKALEEGYAKNAQQTRLLIRQLEDQYAKEAPRPFESGAETDQAAKRCRELEEQIATNMPTQVSQRRNESTSVGWHMEWEKQNKRKIKEWKYLKLRLEHDSEDPNVVNVENLRQGGQRYGPSLNAQIPSHMSYQNPQVQANWETALGPAKVDTALAQAERVAAGTVTIAPPVTDEVMAQGPEIDGEAPVDDKPKPKGKAKR